MISTHRELHLCIRDALDLSRPAGRRGHRHAWQPLQQVGSLHFMKQVLGQ